MSRSQPNEHTALVKKIQSDKSAITRKKLSYHHPSAWNSGRHFESRLLQKVPKCSVSTYPPKTPTYYIREIFSPILRTPLISGQYFFTGCFLVKLYKKLSKSKKLNQRTIIFSLFSLHPISKILVCKAKMKKIDKIKQFYKYLF